ncbi:MAG: HEAT repeat domain-containing protein [Lentisphaeria bacterium]|nr:HEAT repeat domain-containing protein [Lentisphaeria bacterium]NQZ66600.1 HEAT repeat domain-containing protein [Lentisphaeria bacterium]
MSEHRLSDDEVSRFIVDGYHRVDTDLPPELHEHITSQMQEHITEGVNPGDNILPLIPEMYQVLESPEMRSALESLYGKNYMIMPHRHTHELNNNDDGSGRTCLHYFFHQDSCASPAHNCHHYPRHGLILYYCQDVDIDFGPTHVIPGTQYNRGLQKEDSENAVAGVAKPGTAYITHFDIGHGAGVNRRDDETRYMTKFVVTRCQEPNKSDWNNQREHWQMPDGTTTLYPNEIGWCHIWDWMRGEDERSASWHNQIDETTAVILSSADNAEERVRSIKAISRLTHVDDEAIATLISSLDEGDQIVRNAAIYGLAAIGEKAVPALIEHLQSCKTGEEKPSMMTRPPGWGNPMVMEDAGLALSALGEPAVPALIELLEENTASEWAQINAAFALGDIGKPAAKSLPTLVSLLSRSPHIAEAALDAMGTIEGDLGPVLDPVADMMNDRDIDDDRKAAPLKAAMMLARVGQGAEAVEEKLLQAMTSHSYHIRYSAAHALNRIGSEAANKAVYDFLLYSSWSPDVEGASKK